MHLAGGLYPLHLSGTCPGICLAGALDLLGPGFGVRDSDDLGFLRF